MTEINQNRVRVLKTGIEKIGPVAYWMSRDQRVEDNWALLFAQNQAIQLKVPFYVIFTLAPKFLDATLRQYSFMIDGLKYVETLLKRKSIPFFLLTGNPGNEVMNFISEKNISRLVTDFSPLKIHREWKNQVLDKIKIPFLEVDAHNIVPCWLTSSKLEYGAYTIRPKIKKLLPDYLDEFPAVKKHPYNQNIDFKNIVWQDVIKSLKVNNKIKPVEWLEAGEIAAKKLLDVFLEKKIKKYNDLRNDPNEDAQSNLSPYLHFGQISAQRVALEILRFGRFHKSAETFLEELIIRRELSENYCFYNPHYDSLEGIPNWAKETLNSHRKDKREFIYTSGQFEYAQTHDPLWNAAQREMINKGKMHGYMRMYWAKKILEWSKSPEDAIEIAIYLNDKYELDGRDPNGYAGIAWSIGGVHDRPWFERPIYGKIRSMTFDGCKRKFDVNNYIKKISQELL